jgi:SAM-dependent methyltransferase
VKLLNIGCGRVFHSDWVNIDLSSSYPEVQSCDIRKNLPYPDGEFNACYSSHVIEHLKQEQAYKLLAECWRTLESKGVIRIVVPDLETITKEYLKALEQAVTGVDRAESNYDWMMLELYDQVVRTSNGGEMGIFLNNPDLYNKEFVTSRVGSALPMNESAHLLPKTWFGKVLSKNPLWLMQKGRNVLAKHLVALVAGNEVKEAMEEGLFRRSGEIHCWMYDRFSLQRLFEKTGFVDIQVCQANQSRIPNFNSYNLDTKDGKTRKPDSLYMEAIKP